MWSKRGPHEHNLQAFCSSWKRILALDLLRSSLGQARAWLFFSALSFVKIRRRKQTEIWLTEQVRESPRKRVRETSRGARKCTRRRKKVFKNVLGSGSVFNLPNFVATVQRIAPLVCWNFGSVTVYFDAQSQNALDGVARARCSTFRSLERQFRLAAFFFVFTEATGNQIGQQLHLSGVRCICYSAFSLRSSHPPVQRAHKMTRTLVPPLWKSARVRTSPFQDLRLTRWLLVSSSELTRQFAILKYSREDELSFSYHWRRTAISAFSATHFLKLLYRVTLEKVNELQSVECTNRQSWSCARYTLLLVGIWVRPEPPTD